MWLLLAVGSAFFAGLTSILAKCGLKDVDSTVATALRTIVVLVFAWVMVLIVGSASEIGSIEGRTWLFLILSGLCTGASWLCYYKALKMGDVNKVVPIDKSSTVITIILAAVILGEWLSPIGVVGAVLIGIGTLLMIERKDVEKTAEGRYGWIVFAVGSAVFAALTSILGKIGIEGVESNLGTAIRTVVVLAMSWVMVFLMGKQKQVLEIGRRDAGFLVLSGIATGASWLCFFGALQEGPASIVVPIDKLSILVAILFSFVVFGEKLTKRSLLGLLGIVAGTLFLVLFK
jgi:transporter family protein